MLWDRLSVHFDSDVDGVYRSFDVELKGKKLTFRNWSEVVDYPDFPDRLQRFSLYLSKGDRTAIVRSQGLLFNNPLATATGDSEAWCAAVLEEAYVFASARRVWSWWVSGFPLQVIAYICSICTGAVLLSGVFNKVALTPFLTLLVVAWTSLLTAWWVLGLFHRSQGQLVVRSRDGFLKRNAWAIGLAFTAVGATASVLAIFFK